MGPLSLRDAIAATIRAAREAAPAAAVASTLLVPTAWGAPGDLDPSFANFGRAFPLPGLNGPVWSIQPQGDDDFIFAGGDYYYGFYYDEFVSGFTQRLTGNGSVDQTFAALNLADTEVFDVAVQGDGKAVGVGRTLQRTSSSFVLTVFRLNPDGALDPTFGTGGVVRVASDGPSGVASSVVLDPDGRIVVAGVQNERLVVLRLLASGVLDSTFADAGVYTGPDDVSYLRPRILRVAGDGYRVTTHGVACRVLALTEGGAVDLSFGVAGMAGLDVSSTCTSLAAQADGRLLVAGNRNSGGFVVRLLTSGAPDAGFQASAVTDAMGQATALEVTESGSVIVAGTGPAGIPAALVVRLQADGSLDTSFGNGGSTVIDLPSERGTLPTINDILAMGSRILVAGGQGEYWPRQPFVARLSADDSIDGPGVLGILPPLQGNVEDSDGEAIVTVRRTGGRTGRVSVVVQTQLASSMPAHYVATAGEDFATTAATLTWEDGDFDDKQLVIPIVPDTAGAVPDEYEVFDVALSDVEGGAGLGTRVATVAIAADGAPAGQFSIETYQSQNVPESQGPVEVVVSRNYYDDGPVSVTVTPVAGTATPGEDYAADPVTLTWLDGESGSKFVYFAVTNDSVAEEAEQFSVELSAPAGGAIVGPRSAVTFTIPRNDQPPPPAPPVQQSRSNGGGGVGFVSMLLLGLAGSLRRFSPSTGRKRR